VLFQAGQSGKGRAFALRHADIVFAIQPTIPRMKRFMTDFAAQAERAGRPAPKVSLGIQVILGGTQEEAVARRERLEARIPIEAALARLSGTLGVDFDGYDLDRPLEEIPTEASQGLMKAMSGGAEDHAFTLREAATRYGLSIGQPQIVGTPEQVADQMEHIWRETGCHAFNISPEIMPASVEDFVDHVVPILQARGIYRTEYDGNTFRENLGL
jgi:alkanesulfonate monooxygenase SsuD/methylene tetrahydromethanopterin reductase-like flavin-dependent oxidoreductase (luciferase family)